MARLFGSQQRKKMASLGSYDETPAEIQVVAATINGGMNTYVDPADIDKSQLVDAINVRVEADKTFVRMGTSDTVYEKYGTIPNNHPILNVSLFTRFDGSTRLVRWDAQKIYRAGTASWIEITGAGYTVEGRQHTLAINNRFFFSTGRDAIQELNFASDTYAALGNAPKYKYICGFFNRIVGANLYDGSTPNPIQVGWSGDLNFGEWNSLTDISAGNVALVEGEGDFSDKITGLFGFANVMLIARERSLWVAQKQPVATNPFTYQCAFPTFGLDTPDAIAQTRNGITWYDFRSNQVYSYEVGSSPEPIGFAIRDDLKTLITDNKTIQAAYDPIGNRFHLCIPSANSFLSTIYVFDFTTKSWVKDLRLKVNGVFPLDSITTGLKIKQLTGKIKDLMGKIKDLSNITIIPSVISYGGTDGVLTQDDANADDDNGANTPSTFTSKVFQLDKDNLSVSQLLLKFVPTRRGFFDVNFSRNGGQTWEFYKTIVTTVDDVGVRKISTFPKHITTSEFAFQIVSHFGRFELNEYRIMGVSTTETRDK